MEPGCSMSHSQEYPIIPILSRIKQFLVLISISLKSILILLSHLRLVLRKYFFPVCLPVKILKASYLPPSKLNLNILHQSPWHMRWKLQTIKFNLLHLIILRQWWNNKILLYETFFTPPYNPSWVQISV